MFIPSKINLRQILSVCLISVILWASSAWVISYRDRAFAEVLRRDSVDASEEKILSDEEYELAKARRSQLQAERSQQANVQNNAENGAKKLNLDEIVTSVTPDNRND